MMRKFAAAKVEDIVKSIPMPVYAPIEEKGMVQYDRYEEGAKLNLDTCKTEKSPKDLLFPQWEDMIWYWWDWNATNIPGRKMAKNTPNRRITLITEVRMGLR